MKNAKNDLDASVIMHLRLVNIIHWYFCFQKIYLVHSETAIINHVAIMEIGLWTQLNFIFGKNR